MRIRYWSSDVCSSDRVASTNGIIDQTRQRKAGIDPLHERILWGIVFSPGKTHDILPQPTVTTVSDVNLYSGTSRFVGAGPFRDRKSVVSGKRVSVRVDLGERRVLKKKKHTKK